MKNEQLHNEHSQVNLTRVKLFANVLKFYIKKGENLDSTPTPQKHGE